MESNRAARTMFDTLLENCIFYISQLYEFSHRLGQTLPSRDFCGTAALPLKPDIGWHGWHVRNAITRQAANSGRRAARRDRQDRRGDGSSAGRRCPLILMTGPAY